jgi:hypothetical protein
MLMLLMLLLLIIMLLLMMTTAGDVSAAEGGRPFNRRQRWVNPLEVVRLLLGHPSASSIINHRHHKFGQTALWGACCWGYPEVARALLESGADTTIAHIDGITPMAIASRKGHLEVVRLLSGYPSGKATVNARDEEGKTALWWACYYGRRGMVRRRMTMVAALMMIVMMTMMTAGEAAARERGRPHHRRQRRHHPHGHRQAEAASSQRGYCQAPAEVRGGAGGEDHRHQHRHHQQQHHHHDHHHRHHIHRRVVLLSLLFSCPSLSTSCSLLIIWMRG